MESGITLERRFSTELFDHSQATQFKTHNCDAPKLTTETNRQELLDFYREMTVMRKMEVAADQMYKQKLIRGFLHLYIGQVRVQTALSYFMWQKFEFGEEKRVLDF
jgi:pyruvate dehydrogenase E1 component alpha subunit